MRRTLLPTLLALLAAACSEPMYGRFPGIVPAEPMTALRVVVTDSGGKALDGVQVLLIRPTPAGGDAPAAGRTFPRLGALTGPTGEATLHDVPSGSYEMLIRRIGYTIERRSIQVAPGGATSLGVSLRPGRVIACGPMITGPFVPVPTPSGLASAPR